MKKLRYRSLFIASASLVAASSASAADQTWFNAGATNNWNTTETNWDTGAAVWTQNNNAIFGGTGESVALTEAISAASLTFNSTGYSLSGSTVTLTGATPTISTATGTTTTINSILAGTNLTKSGSGTLALGAASTLNGAVSVTGGTLSLTGNYLQSAASVAFSDSALLVNGDTGNFNRDVSINNLTLNNATINTTSAGSGDGGARITKLVTFTGSNTVNRVGGTYQRVLNFNGGIAGTGSILLNCSGGGSYGGVSTIIIQGDTSGFSGELTVASGNAGGVSIQSASGWGVGATLIVNNRVWVNSGTTTAPTSGRYTSQNNVSSDVNQSTSSLVVNTGGTFTTVANVTVGSLSGTGGTIAMSTGKTLTTGALGLTETYAGTIGGTGVAFAKTGAGTMTLSGDNTYSGGTAVNTGTLNAANNTAGQLALGSGNVTVQGGTLAISAATVGQVTLGTGATLAMTSGSLAIDITGASTYDKVIGNGTAHFSLTGGTLQLNGVAGFEGTGGIGNSYNLLSGFAGTGNSVGLNITGYDTNNWLASLDVNTGNLNFTAVPEPSTYGLIGAGALALAAGVRRRRKLVGAGA